MCTVIALPRRVAERIRREAEKLGMSLEEYIIDALSRDLDPRDRAVEYAEATEELLEQAREELAKGGVRQAAEKLWGATALAVKAYAAWRDGKRLTSHRELWGYIDRLVEDLGSWIDDAWNAGNAMHACFYEGWCRDTHVRRAMERIEKLVKEIGDRLREDN